MATTAHAQQPRSPASPLHLAHPLYSMALLCCGGGGGGEEISAEDKAKAKELDAKLKAEKEQQAIERIREILSNSVGDEIYAYWQEFELAESYEAKLVYAFDKLECKCQHLEADLSTWNDKEKACSFDWQDALYDFDPAVLQVRDYLLSQSQDKVKKELDSVG